VRIFLLSSKKSLFSNSKSGRNLFRRTTKNIRLRIGIRKVQYLELSIPIFKINKSEIKKGEKEEGEEKAEGEEGEEEKEEGTEEGGE
jgi:hypothetical protein